MMQKKITELHPYSDKTDLGQKFTIAICQVLLLADHVKEDETWLITQKHDELTRVWNSLTGENLKDVTWIL